VRLLLNVRSWRIGLARRERDAVIRPREHEITLAMAVLQYAHGRRAEAEVGLEAGLLLYGEQRKGPVAGIPIWPDSGR
jgi:hypothetical protein